MARKLKEGTNQSNKNRQKGRSPTSKKSKTVISNASSLNLCNMPQDILEKILGNVSIWHRQRIRGTCKRLKDSCDSMLAHEFKKYQNKYKQLNPNGFASNVLEVIDQSTWAYVKHGFQSTFSGTMLPYLERQSVNEFCLSINKAKLFLESFYRLVEEQLSSDQTSRLLYALTLFGLLKKFQNLTVVSSTNLFPQHWRVVYDLPGTWMAMLWSPRPSCQLNKIVDRHQFLILFADILINVNSSNSFKKVWDSHEQVFVYGHDTTKRIRLPNCHIVLNVCGTKRIINFLKSGSESRSWERLPKDEFELKMEVYCKEALQWGCCTSILFELKKHYSNEENAPTQYEEVDNFANE